jgi:excinuclease ABC subunit A
VVVTGLSGSGKSSLAFDTIFAEGQRKYMESLSAYARQFLDQLKKPDVEDIQGLPPTIAIEQRSSGHNPRSTVATSTEIYDYLRLLFARCGRPTCWHPTKVRKDGTVTERCGRSVSATPASQIVDAVMAIRPGTRAMVLAPVVRALKGFHKDVLEELQSQGWGRARVDGVMHDVREVLKKGGENPLGLGRYEKHDVDAVIDRVVIAPEARQRIAESIEAALKLGKGTAVVAVEKAAVGERASAGEGSSWEDRVFSDRFACPVHPECALGELEPRLFSFNSPFGACKGCDGLGTLMEFDEALVIPNDQLSLEEGAVAAWNKNGPVRAWFNRRLRRFCRETGCAFDRPVATFSKEHRKALLHGIGAADRDRFPGFSGRKWEGVIPNISQWWGSTENESVKEWLSGFMSQTPCRTCLGDRLRVESLGVVLATGAEVPQRVDEDRARHGFSTGRGLVSIGDFTKLNIAEARRVLEGLDLSREQGQIAEPIFREVKARLGFLASVGLEYLSLDRRTATLSGGEAQRIRLATQVGSGLVGACYVLDEPTIGLHQRDNDRLIATLRHLTDIGNTVLVVEHDEDMIRRADHVIDIGPGPGVHGGRVVAQGSVAEVCANPASLTGDYLSGRRKIDLPAKRRALSTKRAVTIKEARENNLKGIDAVFPLGGIVCVTGVSGSGKSTLVNDILLSAAKRHVAGSRVKPGAHGTVTGLKHLDRVIEVDQSPIGRTPRSNPATYTGFFDDVRRVFAQTKEAKVRGYEPGRFSFNVKGGRCEACQGQGVKKVEMHFLPDVFVECEVCLGARYNRETLEVKFRGQSIADVLSMTVEKGLAFFDSHPKIRRFLQCLHDVGLDYVQLGQPSTQLSGGEAQRVKLATELAKGGGGGGEAANADGAEAREEKAAEVEEDGQDERDAEPKGRRGSLPLVGSAGHTLYILDEPTTGLHFEDIRKLVGVLHRLADAGNTLVVIEHNLDVIKCADWLIDLGPEGGDGGGRVVAAGTPEQVAAEPASFTGRYLRPLLTR